MKVLQLNVVVNSGSTGRIAEGIGEILISDGNNSLIGFGRGLQQSASETIKIGGKLDMWIHGIQTLLFDRHGLGSQCATATFLQKVEQWAPDIIHLHNIHGYYLNINLLSKFLFRYDKPIVWTFHDSWPYTGHCTYFDNIQCERWKTECYHCPKKEKYPTSLFIDRSKQNFIDKRKLFGSLRNLNIVTPSIWLSQLVKQSFLQHHNLTVIHNGVDLDTFFIRPDNVQFLTEKGLQKKKIILGVASIWDLRKGLQDFKLLSNMLNSNFQIVLIGLSAKQIEDLPANILGIRRTQNLDELAQWYSAATVFANPTMQDNFPTTNIEALACGTPVITYNTGGSPEAIDIETGTVVEKGNVEQMFSAIEIWSSKDRKGVAMVCRKRAVENFNKDERFKDYLDLYKSLFNKS